MSSDAGSRVTTAQLHARVLSELDRCPVGREHPTHRRLVAGELTPAELERWAIQQWHWHCAFPAVLATLAAQVPAPALRASLLMRAALEDGALPAESAGRRKEWSRVCHALGVGQEQLEAGRATPETETMIAIQRVTAARPFAEGWVGIMAGVDGETQLHTLARRHSMHMHYGIPEEALGYFQTPAGDPLAVALAPLGPYLGELSLDRACEALRLVLHARWGYFSGIGTLPAEATAVEPHAGSRTGRPDIYVAPPRTP